MYNIYLLSCAEFRIVGFLIHLALLWALVRVAVKNLRVRDHMLYTLNAACLSALLAFGVDGFFSFSLRFNAILRVFWVLAAMILAIRYCRLREPAGEPQPGHA